ncbi:E3 ubiquitin-protein ligase TRIM71-like [Argopecten irradians]|uniref:E3 ubiquitin-protein ligase TRIM71-like n=1 Tax=Argopecten irradians TaxID=31199 RepID=UPI0037114866
MAVPISQIPSRRKGQKTCRHHKGRQLVLFCEQCQELACLRCLSSTHRSHTMCELCEITPQKKQDITNFVGKTEKNELVQLQTYIASTDTLLQENDSVFEKLSHDLKTQTEKLKQELDTLTAETLSLYQKMKDDNTKLIQKYKQDLETFYRHLRLQLYDCKEILQQGTPIEIYDTECEINSYLPVQPSLGAISFTPNTNPRHYLELALGKLILPGHGQHMGQHMSEEDGSASSSSDQKQSRTQIQKGEAEDTMKEAEVNLQSLDTKMLASWDSPWFITNLCPISGGLAWTKFNTSLILFGKKCKVSEEIEHKVYIRYISFSPATQRLWVCDNSNNILELVSGSLVHRFGTRTSIQCICASLNNHIIVGMSKSISKYTTGGKMALTTMAATTEKPLVCSPYRIAECPLTNNVAVIDCNYKKEGGDGNQHVVVMDTNFRQLFVFKGDIRTTHKQGKEKENRAFEPTCVVYDSKGNIIIGDASSHKILLLNGRGNVIRTIHTGKDRACQAVGIGSDSILWTVFGGYNVQLLQYNNKTK